LVSSETFTWLRDHFKTALSQTKPEAEDLLLNGVNHIFLHGSTYSPERASWPGWKFYAAVNFNPNNTIWEDAPALFSYLENCQKLLQSGTADNDVLLYWPIHDVWDDYLKGDLFFQFKIHALDEWLYDTPFYKTASKIMKAGYGTDFISDRFVQSLSYAKGTIYTPGGNYQSLVVPDTDVMPLATLKKLVQLKKEGAQIIFQGLPESVPGFANYKEQTEQLHILLTSAQSSISEKPDVVSALQDNTVIAEEIVASGLKYVRRTVDGQKMYYLVNHTAKPIIGTFALQMVAENVRLYDPLNGKEGVADSYVSDGKTFVKLDIASGASLFVLSGERKRLAAWDYFESSDTAYPVKGDWNLRFLKGGPEIPESATIQNLGSWTSMGDKASYFSGTAAYEIDFQNPDTTIEHWKLQLGDVRESAKVWLNDTYLGTLWSNPFEIQLANLKPGTNTLRIAVTNLPANRIRAKELRGEEWKIFKEINIVNKDYEEFDASQWQPMPSGLLGPVSLIPLIKNKSN